MTHQYSSMHWTGPSYSTIRLVDHPLGSVRPMFQGYGTTSHVNFEDMVFLVFVLKFLSTVSSFNLNYLFIDTFYVFLNVVWFSCLVFIKCLLYVYQFLLVCWSDRKFLYV